MKIPSLLILVCCGVMAFGSAEAASTTVDQQYDGFYKNCMGNKSPESDPVRSKYCDCVKDGMKSWDDKTLNDVAEQQLKTPQTPPTQLDTLARACLARVRAK